MSLKKMLIKRAIRKNVQRLQKDMRKSYRSLSKDVGRKISGLKLPRLT